MKRNFLTVFLFCIALLALKEKVDSQICLAQPFHEYSNIRLERRVWDPKAHEWHRFIGADGRGDLNRLSLSDPELWKLLGRNLHNKTVLDIGCGNGYLSRQLYKAGAKVIAVDVSLEMIKIAKDVSILEQYPDIDFRVDVGNELRSIPDGSIDHIVSNYVLMDVIDLEGPLASMYRVLKRGGTVIIVMLHPCFPLDPAKVSEKDGIRTSKWKTSYFSPHEQLIPPFSKEFSTEFVVYHRSLEHYEKAFSEAKFYRESLREPHLTEEQKKLYPELADKFGDHPMSIAFKLIKPSGEKSENPKQAKNRFRHVHQVGNGQNQITRGTGLQIKGIPADRIGNILNKPHSNRNQDLRDSDDQDMEVFQDGNGQNQYAEGDGIQIQN